jgi:hypothetical protein
LRFTLTVCGLLAAPFLYAYALGAHRENLDREYDLVPLSTVEVGTESGAIVHRDAETGEVLVTPE